MKQGEYQKSFLKNNLFVTAGQLLVYSKGIILLPILIKAFGVDLYGSYALLLSYTGIVFGISSFGIGFKYQRYLPSADAAPDRRELFYPQFFFQLYSLIIITLVLFSVNGFFERRFLGGVASYSFSLIVAVLFANFMFAQTTNYFRYSHRMKRYAIANTLNPYLSIVIIVLGIYGLKVRSLDFLLFANSAAMILISIPMIRGILKEIGFRWKAMRLPPLGDDFRLGFPVLLSYIIDFVMSGSDRFVIGYYMSAREVGFYNPAYTLGAFVVMFPKVIGIVLPPLLAKAVDENEEKTATMLLSKSVKIFLALSIPFVVGAAVFAKKILVLLSNRAIAQSSHLITPIIAFGVIFYGLNIILAHGVAFVTLKTKLIFYSNLIAALLNIILNVVLMYFIRDILVAALVSMTSFLTAFVFLEFRTRSLIRIEWDWVFILKATLSSLLMGVGTYFLMDMMPGKLETIFVLLVGVATYFSLLFLLKAFRTSEINFIIDAFSAMKRKAFGRQNG